MKLRLGLVGPLMLLAALASGAACKKSPEPAAQPTAEPAPATPAAPATPSTPPAPAVDPWKPAAAAKDPLPKPFLWTAEKDGVTTHLLGTMHVGIDAEARLPQLVWDRLDAAPAFAVETDVTDRAITQFGGRTSGTLREELGPDYWKKLELAITPQIAEALVHKSAAIPATIIALRALPETPAMDSILLARAKHRNKRVVYLEPASRQAAILEKHMNAKALRLLLDDLDKVDRQGKQLLEAYAAGEEARFLAISDEQRRDALAHGYTAAEYDESIEDLLYKRNASWIAPIEKLHAAGGAFIAVGAMHLIGPRSVIELLQQKGYKLTRVAP
jgi:uncharacterized protein YbaP (TraB family)